MTAEILLKFARKGIILSPEAYDLINSSKNPLDLSSSIILKLKSGKLNNEDLVPVQKSNIEEMMKELGISVKTKKEEVNHGANSFTGEESAENPIQEKSGSQASIETPKVETPKVETTAETKTIETPKVETTAETKTVETTTEIRTEAPKPEKPQIQKPEAPKLEKPQVPKAPVNPAYPSQYVQTIEDTEVSEETKQKYKRNLTDSKVNFDKFKVITDTSNKSYTSGEIGNLIEYFQNRYQKLSGILSKRPELRAFNKINEITENQTDLNLIVMITDIRITKNGHFFLEVEDETGYLNVLISKNDEELIRAARNLMKDEVIGIIAERRPGNELAICKNIIDPGVPRMPEKEIDFATVFTSDIHIGSITFLEDAFTRFTRWINGDFGSEEQRETANNVKYMIVGGDIVDGIGVYPNQDKELAIKDITAQYDEAARLLGDIRSDVKIIITPGNHDASRVAEPQPAVPEKYAKSLYKLNNVEFLSNPSMVSLDGMNVLIYHGRGIDDMVMGSNDFSHERNDLVMKEFLNKRHLAPLYGERTPLASELEDHLVIDKVPDVLHTGHVHINTYTKYKGIHCINSGTFQTQTEFQKIYNIVPTPAEVPIIDVGGKYKQFKFI
ncbi:DNA-directed DNA polymerase II small subunit [uncultured Methanobrevibacter sp.]|uniref:DNA-directed DNA polymerase II small subunit n=1 Tax=uncultured Methanobrevibacter sp. TaxID=253161 RepID=UPI00260E8339